MSLFDTIQHAVAWILTWEAVSLLEGLFVSILTLLGVPPSIASLIFIATAFLIFWKISTDRHVVQRWRWKLRQFLRGSR